MSKINVLDSSIYNLISAGEVVERPASVVKELVENAIDAGAKNVKIEIVSGGKTRIKITDDGCGISADDLETAFLPHATSKILVKDDLFKISTLGFRGEALASIAAVAMVTAISKTDSQDAAAGIELQGGKVTNSFETAGVTGTIITVENLFFATPARLKFLKRDKSEELEITSLVQSLMLAHPEISFTYLADSKVISKTQGNGLDNAVLSVYNREITSNFVKIENTLKEFSISGYVSAPTYFKGNRSYQTVILNGRVISNKTISLAVEKAYEPFMMKRNYPLYVINVKMPYDCLDVNVHPSKFDVRFTDNHEVFSFIYHSVQRVLLSYDRISDVQQIEYVNDNVNFLEENLNVAEEKQNKEVEFKSDFPKFDSFFKNTNSARDDGGAFYRAIKNKIATENVKEKSDFEQQSLDYSNAFSSKTEEFDFSGKIIGQVFETYVFVEKDNYLYVIDQHAAHEKILYDKLTCAEQKYSQPLLIPYIYTAYPAEFDFINGIIDNLTEIGFEISEFSNLSFKVSAVPDALVDINFDKFFAYISNDLVKINVKTNDVIKEKLMQTACKSAIKGGDVLNNNQLDALIRAFSEAETKPLQCPHGRPTVIKFSKTDFEKWFKRII